MVNRRAFVDQHYTGTNEIVTHYIPIYLYIYNYYVSPLRFRVIRRRNRCCSSALWRDEPRCFAIPSRKLRPRPWLWVRKCDFVMVFIYLFYAIDGLVRVFSGGAGDDDANNNIMPNIKCAAFAERTALYNNIIAPSERWNNWNETRNQNER